MSNEQERDDIQTLATQLQHRAGERLNGGADAATEIQAHVMAGLALARIWMPPEDVAAWLRELAGHTEAAAAAARRSDH